MNTWLLAGMLISVATVAVMLVGRDDLALSARVRAALARAIGRQARDIRVHSQGGAVSLSGFTGTADDRCQAATAATDVEGVSLVRNGILLGEKPGAGARRA